MSAEVFDPTPADIGQTEAGHLAPLPPIPVTAVDPVRVQTLPSRQGGFIRRTLAVGTAVRILDTDPRRRRAVLLVFDTAGASDGAILGTTQAQAVSALSFLLPLPGPNIAASNVSSVPFEITSTGELWASAAVAVCDISVMNEQWAD